MTATSTRNHLLTSEALRKSATRKEKNRDAQRRYRQRIKEKISDLQAKLQSQDAQVQTLEAPPTQNIITPPQHHDFGSPITDLLDSGSISESFHIPVSTDSAEDGEQLLMDPRLIFADSNLWSLDEMDEQQQTEQAAAVSSPSETEISFLHNHKQVPASAPAPSKPALSSSELQPPAHPPLSDISRRRRSLPPQILSIVRLAQFGGFKSVDEFCTAYYCSSVRSMPRLANQQRLSRNRGLPKTVSNISAASCHWRMVEKESFYSEIGACTEAIIAQEKRNACEAFHRCLQPRITVAVGETPGDEAALEKLRDVFMSKLPHLWTLLDAIAQTSGGSHSTDNSNRALAAGCLLVGCVDYDNESIWKFIQAIKRARE